MMVSSILLVSKKVKLLKPLCVILSQMTGYIKYFENSGKIKSFAIKNDNVLDKCNEIWDKIKEALTIKFHSIPVYNEKYIKAKVGEFNGVIKTNLLGDKMPKKKHKFSLYCLHSF